jgi:hypothetical protein
MANAKTMTAIGTILFPSLEKPAKAMDGGEGKFEIMITIDKEAAKSSEHAALDSEVNRLLAEYAKETKSPLASLRNPLRPNEERMEKYPDTYKAGGFFFTAKTKFQPPVFDRAKRPITDLGSVYAGQEGRILVSAYKFSRNGNKGVALSLEAVQVTNADKPRLRGGGNVADAFSDLPGAADPFAA